MTQRIAILGAGVMGETLLSALLDAGRTPTDLVISEKRADRGAELRATYGVEVTDNATAASGADVVLIVVKPQDVAGVLSEIGPAVQPGNVVVSLAAGIRLETLEKALAEGVVVFRAMPNTPALVGKGMFGVSPGRAATDEHISTVVELLATGGEVVVLDEAHQDAVTAVSGSGPAYLFYLAEAMVEGGIACGLDESTARILTTQTLVGAAALLAESDDSAEELRRRVTSPHGTTAAAIATFDALDVRRSVVAGVAAAAARSAELSGPA